MKNGRFQDVSTSGALCPISVDNIPLVSLQEALGPLRHLVPNLDSYAYITTAWVEELENGPLYGHSVDEASSINLYTREWRPPEDSLYFKLNTALRATNRAELNPFLPFLKLLLTALSKLPRFTSDTLTLWRGACGDLSSLYVPTKKVWWWGFSSCTTDMPSAISFLGNTNQPRVLWNIHFSSPAFDISVYSAFPNEVEVLLLPGRYLQVVTSGTDAFGLTIIEMKEILFPASVLAGVNFPTINTQLSPPKQSKTFPLRQKPFNYTAQSLPVNPSILWRVEPTKGQENPSKSINKNFCENCETEPNLATLWCEACSVYYCAGCSKMVHSTKATKKHSVLTLQEKAKRPTFTQCPRHFMDSVLFCFDCQVLMCQLCFVEDHLTHSTTSVLNVANKRKTELEELISGGFSWYLPDLDQKIQTVTQEIQSSTSELQQLKERVCALEALLTEKEIKKKEIIDKKEKASQSKTGLLNLLEEMSVMELLEPNNIALMKELLSKAVGTKIENIDISEGVDKIMESLKQEVFNRPSGPNYASVPLLFRRLDSCEWLDNYTRGGNQIQTIKSEALAHLDASLKSLVQKIKIGWKRSKYEDVTQHFETLDNLDDIENLALYLPSLQQYKNEAADFLEQGIRSKLNYGNTKLAAKANIGAELSNSQEIVTPFTLSDADRYLGALAKLVPIAELVGGVNNEIKRLQDKIKQSLLSQGDEKVRRVQSDEYNFNEYGEWLDDFQRVEDRTAYPHLPSELRIYGQVKSSCLTRIEQLSKQVVNLCQSRELEKVPELLQILEGAARLQFHIPTITTIISEAQSASASTSKSILDDVKQAFANEKYYECVNHVQSLPKYQRLRKECIRFITHSLQNTVAIIKSAISLSALKEDENWRELLQKKISFENLIQMAFKNIFPEDSIFFSDAISGIYKAFDSKFTEGLRLFDDSSFPNEPNQQQIELIEKLMCTVSTNPKHLPNCIKKLETLKNGMAHSSQRRPRG